MPVADTNEDPKPDTDTIADGDAAGDGDADEHACAQ